MFTQERATLDVCANSRIVYWEPGWVGNANLGSGCAVRAECRQFFSEPLLTNSLQDNLLVSSTGATRTSINMFSQDM